MASKKNTKKRRETKSNSAAKATVSSSDDIIAELQGSGWHTARETIESIVIAFVLAFLFRTFEAEAFVIPTGSMSPSLQGMHKDVSCSECGYRFRASASSEGADAQARLLALRQRGGYGSVDLASQEVVAGMCPMCRQTMAFRPDLPPDVPAFVNTSELAHQTSYPGDRILVNKYSYLYNAPERWDVVVFKFPGNGEMNYIKRLVGLPGETLQIYQGDVFTRPLGEEGEFEIERKPADKVEVMLQPVHDTDYESATLYNNGWPLRWQGDENWNVDTNAEGQTVSQKFKTEAASELSWLRYHHILPEPEDWEQIRLRDKSDQAPAKISPEEWPSGARPQLIRDFNSYNAMLKRGEVYQLDWKVFPWNLGLHWVGDLAVESEVTIEQAKGELVLDLVEAGKHFSCTFDLSSGEAKLGIEGYADYSPSAKTAIKSNGNYTIKFAKCRRSTFAMG